MSGVRVAPNAGVASMAWVALLGGCEQATDAADALHAPVPTVRAQPAEKGAILTFDETVELESGLDLRCQAFIGPAAKLELTLDSFPAGTIVRAVSYFTHVTHQGELVFSSAGLYFMPLDGTRALGSGGTLHLGTGSEAAERRSQFVSWSLRLVEGHQWGTVREEDDFVLVRELGPAPEINRERLRPARPAPK
jgi:hypothetical protein